MRLYFCFFLALLAMLSVTSCEQEPLNIYSGMGKKPVYIPKSELGQITNLAPQPIAQTGTIYLIDTLFLLLEYKRGIHVFSIRDTAMTQSLTFWQVPAITDFSISGSRLYADSWKDLVTIDISNVLTIKEIARAKDSFTPIMYPVLYQGIFECVDESRGVLIGWEDIALEDVDCRTF
jgi:hypothetical protein